VLETVSLTVGGAPFAFETISVHAGVKHAARSAQWTFVDTVGAPAWPPLLKSQPTVTVTAGGDLIFTGYLDRCAPHLTPKAYVITANARSKGQDAIDCSVDHTKPDYVTSDVLKVAKDQDAFSINFTADFTPEGFDRWRPNPGHTLFEALVPLVEEEGATLAGQADGSVKITIAGASAQAQGGYLLEGQNIWEASADFDDSAKHSKVKSHGQAYKGSGAQATQIVGEADNDTINRYRPHHHHHDRQTSRDRLKRHAKRRRDKECGEGTRASMKVRGWRDTSGKLWTPGNKVYVMSPSLSLCQYMLIESVLYAQTAGKSSEGGGGESGGAGTIATLSLVDPRAHGGAGGGVNQSGGGWGFDESSPT
jgi:prophage tail gpP-like protein